MRQGRAGDGGKGKRTTGTRVKIGFDGGTRYREDGPIRLCPSLHARIRDWLHRGRHVHSFRHLIISRRWKYIARTNSRANCRRNWHQQTQTQPPAPPLVSCEPLPVRIGVDRIMRHPYLTAGRSGHSFWRGRHLSPREVVRQVRRLPVLFARRNRLSPWSGGWKCERSRG